ncbi:hypothetical protein LXL04_027327 [Taraxacum kok-saghyz]
MWVIYNPVFFLRPWFSSRPAADFCVSGMWIYCPVGVYFKFSFPDDGFLKDLPRSGDLSASNSNRDRDVSTEYHMGEILIASLPISFTPFVSRFNEFGVDGGSAAKSLTPKFDVFSKHLTTHTGFQVPEFEIKFLVAGAIAFKAIGTGLLIFDGLTISGISAIPFRAMDLLICSDHTKADSKNISMCKPLNVKMKKPYLWTMTSQMKGKWKRKMLQLWKLIVSVLTCSSTPELMFVSKTKAEEVGVKKKNTKEAATKGERKA